MARIKIPFFFLKNSIIHPQLILVWCGVFSQGHNIAAGDTYIGQR